jgi:5-carboxymethyl-2-hydroxymuconate isomerase
VPHCIIEYSNGLDNSKLIDSVHKGASNSQLFDEHDIKTRSIGFSDHKVNSTINTFVHVTTKILSGRTLEQRSTLSHSILAELQKLNYPSTSLTVEVVEIERESYAKEVTCA